MGLRRILRTTTYRGCLESIGGTCGTVGCVQLLCCRARLSDTSNPGLQLLGWSLARQNGHHQLASDDDCNDHLREPHHNRSGMVLRPILRANVASGRMIPNADTSSTIGRARRRRVHIPMHDRPRFQSSNLVLQSQRTAAWDLLRTGFHHQ